MSLSFEAVDFLPKKKEDQQINKESNEKRNVWKSMEKAMRTFMAVGIFTFGVGVPFEELKTKYSPEKYLEYAGIENEMQQEALIHQVRYLQEQFSQPIIGHLMEGNRAAKKSRERELTELKIAGFEKIGLNNEDLSMLWSEKFYPAGTINGQLSEVVYANSVKSADPTYNINSLNSAEVTPYIDKIQFNSDGSGDVNNKENLIKTLDWHFSHELGHINDWVNSNNLSPEKRVEFLTEVLAEFDRVDSFRDGFGYIDSINNTNKQKEKYIKVAEYWGILCEHYLTFPDVAKSHFLESEIDLLEKWLLKKGEKTDDVIRAKLERDKFVEVIIKGEKNS